jgi:hypothetical protein
MCPSLIWFELQAEAQAVLVMTVIVACLRIVGRTSFWSRPQPEMTQLCPAYVPSVDEDRVIVLKLELVDWAEKAKTATSFG